MTGEQLLRVYGPTIALLLTLALLVVLLPTSGEADDVVTGAPGTQNAPTAGAVVANGSVELDSSVDGAGPTADPAAGGGARPGAVDPAPGREGAPLAPVAGPATADGKVAIVESGPDCRSDGRMVGISVWQPPCVAWETGTPNGGATSRGVAADKVKVILYTVELNTAEFAIGTAAGIQQSQEQIETYTRLWLHYYNNHTQTYGRQVEFKIMKATGTDEAAARADVRRAALEEKAFGFIGACCSRAQLQEGAAHGLVMVNSPIQPLAADLAQNPYAITRAPAVDWVFEDAGQYLCARLAGRKAKWAADPTIQQSGRKLGLLYTESGGDAPLGGIPTHGSVVGLIERELARCGERLAEKVGINFDTASWGNQAQNAMAKMQAAGVTTIVFFAPILSQVFMTQAADRQAYFPEWYIGGTCCNDAVIVNRAASPTQTSQFFGTSNQFFWWRDDASTFEGVREAVVGNEGAPLPNVGSSGSATNNTALTATIWWPLIQGFFNCLHLAGPTLTPETWRAGCNLYGSVGGMKQGYPYALRFFTLERPFMIQDQAEWWWDPNETCNDEANRSGRGCTVWVAGGARTQFKQWTNAEPDLFNPATAALQPNQPVIWEHRHPPGHRHGRCHSCP